MIFTKGDLKEVSEEVAKYKVEFQFYLKICFFFFFFFLLVILVVCSLIDNANQ